MKPFLRIIPTIHNSYAKNGPEKCILHSPNAINLDVVLWLGVQKTQMIHRVLIDLLGGLSQHFAFNRFQAKNHRLLQPLVLSADGWSSKIIQNTQALRKKIEKWTWIVLKMRSTDSTSPNCLVDLLRIKKLNSHERNGWGRGRMGWWGKYTAAVLAHVSHEHFTIVQQL